MTFFCFGGQLILLTAHQHNTVLYVIRWFALENTGQKTA